MENPWLELNVEETKIHPMDESVVREFNLKGKNEVQFSTELLPDPYIGNLNAQVLVLALNPGLSEEDYVTHAEEVFRDLYMDNLHQQDTEYPFYYLNPLLDCPGSRWWKNKLRWLIEKVDVRIIAESICCVQFMPYHSVRYKHPKKRLPTQEFTQKIILDFIAKGAPIIFMRSRTKWIELVPELEYYERTIVLKNPRNPTFSPKNMGEENFDKITQFLVDVITFEDTCL